MAKDDDVSIFDELDDKLDDFFAEDDDLFAEDDDDIFADESDDLTKDEVAIEQNELADESDQTAEIAKEQTSVSDTFSEPETSNNVVEDSNCYNSENPLEQLKAIVLEMDWEISDENLNKYLNEIKNLIENYKNDRPIYLFFKLHATIGNYMLTKKARAHPDALKFLYGVYDSLEKALSVGLPLVEKNRMILSEVNNFKSLKKKLFPGFYSDEVQNVQDNVSHAVDKQTEEELFDISSLPVDVQNGINQYIEKMISEKIESISKK